VIIIDLSLVLPETKETTQRTLMISLIPSFPPALPYSSCWGISKVGVSAVLTNHFRTRPSFVAIWQEGLMSQSTKDQMETKIKRSIRLKSYSQNNFGSRRPRLCMSPEPPFELTNLTTSHDQTTAQVQEYQSTLGLSHQLPRQLLR